MACLCAVDEVLDTEKNTNVLALENKSREPLMKREYYLDILVKKWKAYA